MSGGWTIVDAGNNKSLPIQGTSVSGARAPYFAPSPGNQDPVGKMRMSTPQALIDTDFEYGTQPTKWESIAIQNNRQSCYYIPQQPLTVTSIQGDGVNATVTIQGSGFSVTVGQPVFIQNSNSPYANGWWYVTSANSTSIVCQIAVGTSVVASNQYNAALTYVYVGYFYSNCGIQVVGGATAFTVSGSTVTVTSVNPHGLSAGSLVYVLNTGGYATNPINGAQTVATVPTANSFTYTNAAGTPSGLPAFVTANITASNTAGAFSVATTPLVGLQVNMAVVVTGTNSGTSGLVAGTYLISATNGTTTFTLTTTTGAAIVTVTSGTNTGLTFTAQTGNAAGQSSLFARPAGFVEARTFDGGVAFSAGGAVIDQQLIRQTRRYFRYQSGKGIQFSTGSSLKPALFITSITGAGSTATVTSRYQHNLTAGAKISVFGADQGVYNGNFTVLASGLTPTAFTYTTQIPVGANTTATGQAIRVSPTSWYGSANRVGMFDLQNGMFFEYDGQALYAVLRNSINQANGTVAVTNGSAVVTGTGTQFSTQCLPGAYVVIRGQSYRVVSVASDTSMYVTPEYRGSTISGAIMSLTLETRIPQSKWADPCDGSGPSGYTLDLTRMQMWFIDYSWYGAGVIRYGIRTTSGQINYVVQIQNNNIQFEAYMRTGNMAAHYESNGIAPTTFLTSNLSATNSTLSAAIGVADVTVPVTSTANYNSTGVVKIDNELIYYTGISGSNLIGCTRGFGGTTAAVHTSTTTVAISSIDIADCTRIPPSGTVKIQGSGVSGVVEYIAFSGNDGSILYGLTRAQAGGAVSAQSFTYSATAPISVMLSSPDTVPSLSHWGSSVIMDGRFDDDKSLIFNYGSAPVTTNSTSPIIVMAIRVAPSVDNGQIGLFGAKEIINRMQLQLDSLGIVATGATYLINLVLNGYATGALSSGFVAPIQLPNGITSSLAQVAVNTNAVTTFGGESVAAAFCQANGVTTLDLSNVRDLGNSILGGGTSNTVPTTQAGFYPDGPDILYVVAQANVSSTSTITARLSWKEAQA